MGHFAFKIIDCITKHLMDNIKVNIVVGGNRNE